jgi:hypothetical protein
MLQLLKFQEVWQWLINQVLKMGENFQHELYKELLDDEVEKSYQFGRKHKKTSLN